MKRKCEKLPGAYYFESASLPLGVRRIEGAFVNHEHDYTGIPHRHDFAELVIVRDGRGEQVVNGSSYPVGKGDAFVIQDNADHYFPDYRELKLVNVIYSPALLRSMHGLLRRIPGYNMIFIMTPGLRRVRTYRNHFRLSPVQLMEALEIIARLERELQEKKTGFEASAAALFLELTIRISRSFREEMNGKDTVVRIGRLLSLLEENYRKDWTLGQMSREAAMSPNNFLRVFKQATDDSPLHYLSRVRLKNAKRLLLNSDLSIGEIADGCGFRDSNYFSKKFTAEFKLSPRKYRGGRKQF